MSPSICDIDFTLGRPIWYTAASTLKIFLNLASHYGFAQAQTHDMFFQKIIMSQKVMNTLGTQRSTVDSKTHMLGPKGIALGPCVIYITYVRPVNSVSYSISTSVYCC